MTSSSSTQEQVPRGFSQQDYFSGVVVAWMPNQPSSAFSESRDRSPELTVRVPSLFPVFNFYNLWPSAVMTKAKHHPDGSQNQLMSATVSVN